MYPTDSQSANYIEVPAGYSKEYESGKVVFYGSKYSDITFKVYKPIGRVDLDTFVQNDKTVSKAMKQMADEHLKTVELYERRLENILPDDKKKKPSSKERYAKRTEAELSKSHEKPDGETSGTTAKKTTKKSVGGRNKAADAAVQEEAAKQREEELERQLQEHWKNDPNIK